MLGYARSGIPQPSTPTGQFPPGAPWPHCISRTPQCLFAGIKQEDNWGKAGDSVQRQQDLFLVVS